MQKAARRKTRSVDYSGFLSAFGFFGGRSFFAAALAEAAAPVFAEEASLLFCGAVSFVFGAVAGGSTSGGRARPAFTRPLTTVVISGSRTPSQTGCLTVLYRRLRGVIFLCLPAITR